MNDDAFFFPDGDVYLPQPICRGPWDPGSLNGRVVAGLLGAVVEARHGGGGFRPARMTVDMFRLPRFDPVAIETEVVRDGGRLRLVTAHFVSGGTPMALATVQFLREGENAAGDVWRPEPWAAPPPDQVPRGEQQWRMWEFRPVTGAFGTDGQRSGWMRELRPAIAGLALTPWARAAAACDFASPFSHSGSAGLGYINTDVTLALHRLPAGEWIGVESGYHGADDGIALGQCRLYDEAGAIGLATCLALAQKQALSPR
ncbi:thioesterase family protein [Sphingomonas sp.]|uniref:thioesterase family protein n=1 Tax=Sphingomonas sp. TaxID=28214 RepID=UPI003CC529EC